MNERVELYIQDILTNFPTYQLTKDDQKQITRIGIAKWILQKLIRNGYRRKVISEESKATILKNIEYVVSQNMPLSLTAGFGGYKQNWVQSYPRVDWAEVFHLANMFAYLAPILAAYEPGVNVEYESEDFIIEYADNYPKEDLDAYSDSFVRVQQFFERVIPANLKLSYVRCRDQYDIKQLVSRIEDLTPIKIAELKALPDDDLARRISRSVRNYVTVNSDNANALEDQIVAKAKNLAFLDADYELRQAYFEREGNVPFVFTFGVDEENVGDWLTLGSTKASFVDFWAGTGVLEVREDRIIPRIFSKEQFESYASGVKTFELSAPPLPHLKMVYYLDQKLNF